MLSQELATYYVFTFAFLLGFQDGLQIFSINTSQISLTTQITQATTAAFTTYFESDMWKPKDGDSSVAD